MFVKPVELNGRDLASIPLNGNVYVISDSEYKIYKQKEAMKEISLLEERAVSYENTAVYLRGLSDKLRLEAGIPLPSVGGAKDEQPQAPEAPVD